jgi:hypothetical protein
MKRSSGITRALLVVLFGAGLAACDGLLEVSDPGRFVDEDLDEALEAVANGVEGTFYLNLSYHFTQMALLSDEFRHTGTWAPWDDIDKGRVIYGGSQADTWHDLFLQNRWFAGDARDRFERVLGDAAASSPLMVQVNSVEAWADLIIGTSFCESPLDPGGPAAPREAVLEQAATRAAAAATLAEQRGMSDWYHANKLAEARAHLYLGNWAQAASAASTVPDGFIWYAQYSANSNAQNNSIVTLSTATFNTASGMRNVWWDQVDTEADRLIDPYTGELDDRVPIRFRGNNGVDGVTPHYSQWKYTERGADIPLFKASEARLIQAEVLMREGAPGEALDIINDVRTTAGLTGHAATTDPDLVQEYLLHERFAEFFLEGKRSADLLRFDLYPRLMQEGVFVGGVNPRAVLFPMSAGEAINNENIADDIGQRCLVTASVAS